MRKATVLNAAHRQLHARMMDFGGWDMPLSYGSQIEEHHAVRRDCGMFDTSHMLAVDLAGPDVRAFLSRLLANDVAKLAKPGKALYTAMLNDRGGVMDDLIVYRLGGEQFRLVVNAGTADKDLEWIEARRLAWQHLVAINPRRDCAMIAVQGPGARTRVWQVLPDTQALTEALPPFSAAVVGDYFIARTGYTGEDGFELILPAELADSLWRGLLAAGVAPCGLGARDTLRLEAGMSLYGQDLDEDTSPLDAGLAWTVVLAGDRDFVGKAALLREGARWRQLGLVLLDRGVLRGHQAVVSALGPGHVTSGTFSPTMEKSIALARLPPGIEPGAIVEVEIRQRRVAARVVQPPFVRHGRILV